MSTAAAVRAAAATSHREMPATRAPATLATWTPVTLATTRVAPPPLHHGMVVPALAWLSSLKVAPVAAPRASLRRILVFPSCSRWSLELADAVCWGLPVEEVRSDPYIRMGTLGFFVKGIVITQLLILWANIAIVVSVSTTAHHPPRPTGLVGAALPIARAAVRLAVSRLAIAVRRRPMARTPMLDCAATTSPSRRAAPTGPTRATEARRRHRVPIAVTSVDGPPPATVTQRAEKLLTRGAAWQHCVPASAWASSQKG
jgi:hypothetical protein